MSGYINVKQMCMQLIEHRAALIDTAVRIVGCRQRAEDIVQDAYVKIAGLVETADIMQPVSYLHRVVRNLAIDRHRRLKYEANMFAEDVSIGCFAHELLTPESIVSQRQMITILMHALSALPKRTQIAFFLYRLSGLTQREIALQLHISTTLVNFMIRDAVLHCKKCLQYGYAIKK